MDTKYKISAVSYLNTLPFLYGLENDDRLQNLIDLSVDYPAQCAKKVLEHEVDIGLIPVAALHGREDLQVISDFCIGSDGDVDSVLLVSEKPLREIDEILLDYQSRTSVNLVRILAREYWKISPRWIQATRGFENSLNGKAAVIIGDRAFRFRQKARYIYDLSKEWKNYTGLPFVFAVWAANKEVDPAFVRVFNRALEKGINDINSVLRHYNKQITSIIPQDYAYTYLTQRIDYRLDKPKRIAIETFLKKMDGGVI